MIKTMNQAYFISRKIVLVAKTVQEGIDLIYVAVEIGTVVELIVQLDEVLISISSHTKQIDIDNNQGEEIRLEIFHPNVLDFLGYVMVQRGMFSPITLSVIT